MKQQIPAAELEILAILWELSEATAREVRESLQPVKDHATISTLLRRLETRGLVKRSRRTGEREFRYRPIGKPETVRMSLLVNLLRKAFAGSGIEMAQTLFQATNPSPKEIDELQALLENLKNAKGKEK